MQGTYLEFVAMAHYKPKNTFKGNHAKPCLTHDCGQYTKDPTGHCHKHRERKARQRHR